MVTVEFDFMGEAVRLALVAGEYVGGGLAVLLLDATDPRSEGYMAEWGALTANVPATAEWCRGRGNIAIDADVPAALLEALETAGAVRMAGRRREVRGRRVGGRRRMGGRPGRFRGCRDHRLRDGADGLYGRGGIAAAATRTGMPATARPCGVSRGCLAPSPDPCAPKG